MDREKVVKALECLKEGSYCECCDYKPYDDCIKRVATDALALLKLQQLDIEALKNTIQGMVEGQCIIAGDKRLDVVRCKDCISFYKNDNMFNTNAQKGMRCKASSIDPDWFCADGERK